MNRTFRMVFAVTALLVAMLAPTTSIRAHAAAQPCRQDELESLMFLVGSWQVEVEVRLSLGGPWESSSANAEITRELDGCTFVERLHGALQGRPFEALTILAWHPDRRVVQRLFVDSGHGLLQIAEGEPGATAAVGTDLEVFVDFVGAFGPVRSRIAYLEITPNSFVVESARSVDGGATWDVNGRLRYRRAGTEASRPPTTKPGAVSDVDAEQVYSKRGV